jgi:hypothetical protein
MPFVFEKGVLTHVSPKEILAKGTPILVQRGGQTYVKLRYKSEEYPYENIIWDATYPNDPVRPNDHIIFRDGNPLNTELWNLHKLPGKSTSAEKKKQLSLGNAPEGCSECGKKLAIGENGIAVKSITVMMPTPATQEGQIGARTRSSKTTVMCADCWATLKRTGRCDGSDLVLRRDGGFWFYDGAQLPTGFTWAQEDARRVVRIYFGAHFRECKKLGTRLDVMLIKNGYQVSGFEDRSVVYIPDDLKCDEIGIRALLTRDGQRHLRIEIPSIMRSIHDYDVKFVRKRRGEGTE